MSVGITLGKGRSDLRVLGPDHLVAGKIRLGRIRLHLDLDGHSATGAKRVAGGIASRIAGGLRGMNNIIFNDDHHDTLVLLNGVFCCVDLESMKGAGVAAMLSESNAGQKVVWFLWLMG